MACTSILKSIGRPCAPQIGGVKAVYLLSAGTEGNPVFFINDSQGNIVAFRAAEDADGRSRMGIYAETHDSIGAIDDASDIVPDLTAAGVTSGSFSTHIVRIDVARQGAVVTSEYQGNRENGTGYFQNSVTIPALGLSADVLDLVANLAAGGCIVVVETYGGQFIGFGFSRRATLDTSAITTGAAWSEVPGATITLIAEENGTVLPDLILCDDDGDEVEDQTPDLIAFFKNWLVQ